MSRGRPRSLEKIQKDIEKRMKAGIDELAEKLAYEIQQLYNSVIDQFYSFDAFPSIDSYGEIRYSNTPNTYKRTFSLYAGSSGTDNLYSNIMDYGDSVETGITVDAKYISFNPYTKDTDWVFDRAFFQGIHGFYLKDNYKKIKYLKKIKRNNHYYTYLVPRVNQPKPKDEMDRLFKKLTKKKNIDLMSNEIMKKHFRL